jgi:restriction system protein
MGGLGLSPEDLAEPHNERLTEVEYRLAWARTYLKANGLLDNTSRGVWVLTAKGQQVTSVDEQDVVRTARQDSKARRAEKGASSGPPRGSNRTTPNEIADKDPYERAVIDAEREQRWQEHLMSVLLGLTPGAFERLCQRMLRESGFVKIEVTGRSGDGGIDGVGIVQLGGLLGFPILFQCKRYKGSVSPGEIRDFRGAMIGRADRGLVLTTGTFTSEAKKEATRDGAPPIALVDGEQLIEKLKELKLGVQIRMIEDVTVDVAWFQSI